MPAAIEWTREMDRRLETLRNAGNSWDAIAEALGMSRYTALARAKELGIHKPKWSTGTRMTGTMRR